MSGAKFVLCLGLLGLVAAVCVVQAQDSIKMCGRDLIRHAVSYCGNSRLKRNLQNLQPQHLHASKSDQNSSSRPNVSTELPSVSSESEDKSDMESQASHWLPLSARMRRTALKISDICCEKGCSKKELIQFC